MAVSYHRAREIMAGVYAGECTTSPEGYENDRYWKVPVDSPITIADDGARLISKQTGEVAVFYAFPFDEQGLANIARINAMTPVYDTTADPEYISLLKRYQAEHHEGYFAGHSVHGLSEQQIKADIRAALTV